MFIGRKNELLQLEQYYRQDGSSLMVVYGHKGVGKTTLLRHYAGNKPFAYYLARPCPGKEQLYLWGRELGMGEGNIPSDFSQVLRLMCESCTAGEQKRLLVIDEFQNLLRYAEGFFEQLIRFVREYEAPLMVVLLSDSISFVEYDLVPRMGEGAREIQRFFKLPELGFMDCVKFFRGQSARKCMEIYSILGGIPAYWEQFDPEISPAENVKRHILKKGCFLREEGFRLVSEELRDINVYSTLLEAMASGKLKLNELHKHTGFSRAKISVYIKNMMERELTEKVFSFDSASSVNAMKGVYRISLRFLEFTYRFLYPNMTDLERMSEEEFYDKYLSEGFVAFHQGSFRKVCGEYLSLLNEKGRLPFIATMSGEWMGKNGHIDIVMQNEEGNSLLAFCDWTHPEVGEKELQHDLQVVKASKLHPDQLILFSAGHFSKGLRHLSRLQKNLILVDIDAL